MAAGEEPGDLVRRLLHSRGPGRAAMSDVVLALAAPSRREAFSSIYARSLWGAGETRSGPGSTLANARRAAVAIRELAGEVGARTILDAGCGEATWQLHVSEGIVSAECCYRGLDLVPAVIRELSARHKELVDRGLVSFEQRDLVSDPLPDGLAEPLLILCRQALNHLDVVGAQRVLTKLRGHPHAALLATTYPSTADNSAFDSMRDSAIAYRPYNLEAEPFGLGPPDRLIAEGGPPGSGCLDEDSENAQGQRMFLGVWFGLHWPRD